MWTNNDIHSYKLQSRDKSHLRIKGGGGQRSHAPHCCDQLQNSPDVCHVFTDNTLNYSKILPLLRVHIPIGFSSPF